MTNSMHSSVLAPHKFTITNVSGTKATGADVKSDGLQLAGGRFFPDLRNEQVIKFVGKKEASQGIGDIGPSFLESGPAFTVFKRFDTFDSQLIDDFTGCNIDVNKWRVSGTAAIVNAFRIVNMSGGWLRLGNVAGDSRIDTNDLGITDTEHGPLMEVIIWPDDFADRKDCIGLFGAFGANNTDSVLNAVYFRHEEVTLDDFEYVNDAGLQAIWVNDGVVGAPAVLDLGTKVHSNKSAKLAYNGAMAAGSWTNDAAASYGDISDYTGVNNGMPIQGSFAIYVYIVDVTSLANNGAGNAITLFLGSSNADFIKKGFPLATLANGWNLLNADMTTAILSGNPDWTAADYAKIEIFANGNNIVYADYFIISSNSVARNWFAVTRAAGVQTSTNTGVIFNPDQPRFLDIDFQYVAAAWRANFCYHGVIKVQTGVNLPANTVSLQPAIELFRKAGTPYTDIDFMGVWTDVVSGGWATPTSTPETF